MIKSPQTELSLYSREHCGHSLYCMSDQGLERIESASRYIYIYIHVHALCNIFICKCNRSHFLLV